VATTVVVTPTATAAATAHNPILEYLMTAILLRPALTPR
jgi:hypothetical protein